LRHEISHRSLAAKESKQVHNAGCVAALLLPILPAGVIWIAGVFGTATLAALIRGKPLSPALGNGIQLFFSLVAAAFWVFFFVDIQRRRARVRKDRKTGQVEVVRVFEARLVEREPYNDEGPLYFFGIGEGKVLFLGGQWIFNYGTDRADGDEDEARERKWRFPSSSFVVHRLPLSGEVIDIEVAGHPLEPEALLAGKGKAPEWLVQRLAKDAGAHSVLMDGDFEDLLRAARESPGTRRSV